MKKCEYILFIIFGLLIFACCDNVYAEDKFESYSDYIESEISATIDSNKSSQSDTYSASTSTSDACNKTGVMQFYTDGDLSNAEITVRSTSAGVSICTVTMKKGDLSKTYTHYDSPYLCFADNYSVSCTKTSNKTGDQYLCQLFACNQNEGSQNDDIFQENSAEVNCEGIIGTEMLELIGNVFKWIQIIAPIFVIIISGVEFTGVILQDDKDALKKVSGRLIKRLIIAIALFFIPMILDYVLNIFNEISIINTSTCGIGR